MTRQMLRLLEEMAGTVYGEHCNEHVLKSLVGELHDSLDDKYDGDDCGDMMMMMMILRMMMMMILRMVIIFLCRGVWGSHLGSETLLRRHAKSRRRIACISMMIFARV